LDSLFFQRKLIDIELEHMKSFYKLITNRMYSAYYKLFKIVSAYINNTFNDKKIIDIVIDKDFPIYKDLEPFKDYNFDNIIDLHETIISVITSLDEYLNTKILEFIN